MVVVVFEYVEKRNHRSCKQIPISKENRYVYPAAKKPNTFPGVKKPALCGDRT